MLAERITDSVAYHGEGPVWSPRWGGLRWHDMLASDRLSLEGACVPDGRFYCGSRGYDRTSDAGSPYWLDPDGRGQPVREFAG